MIHMTSGPMSIQDHHGGSADISLSSHMGLDMPSLEPPMSSNENPPQLTLSDIMHHMSPSPVPAEDLRPEDSEIGGQFLNGSQREREESPKPLTEADVVAMRRRLHELGFLLDRDRNELNIGDMTRHSDDFTVTTLKEKELVNMVLRLTDPLPVDASQLERQADIISVLTAQRDFLVRQAEEDRDRWRSEREGWDRIAEALLSHSNKSGTSATREDETDRQKIQLESENRALRDKLQDTQNRLSSLESELIKLKPLLLMQPYSVAHLRQNFASPQTPNTVLATGPVPHRFPDVRPNKPTPDIKGKRREADSALPITQLEAIPEDLGTNEERGLGPTSLARSPHSASSTPSANLFSGATLTADIYRRPEPLPQYSYPYNYNYATPSASPSKSTLIPPNITLNSPSSSTVHGQHHNTAGSTFPTYPSQSHPLPQASPTPSPQRRSRDYINNSTTTQNASIRRRKHGIAPLTSDARIEHVLLAARRIGRERATLVAGIQQLAEHEKEIHARELELIKARQDLEKSEKERLERLANGTSGMAYYRSADILTSPQQRNTGRGSTTAGVPRTPKRSGGVGVTHYPALSGALGNSPISSPTRVPASTGPSTFVFVNTSAVAGSSRYSGGGGLNTPDQLGSVHKRGGSARGGSRNLPSNPPTPLDSLLDAARSMMDDGAGAGEKAGGKMNGTRKASEHPESPVPKRRRVSSSGSKMIGRGGGLAGISTATRVKSALDVLADQAAAAFDDEPGQTRRGSNTKGKGKEKSDESLSGGGDGGVDNAQGDLDDSWPRGSTSASASASSMGPSRGRSRAKNASINTRPTGEPTSTSLMSLRPVRQASQKRLASQELQPPSSVSTTTVRGKGKFRGRPKGNKSLPRSAVSVKSSSTSKTNSPLGVITTHSPLDEEIALLAQKDRKRERIEEHLTVVEWGDRSAGDEDVEGELGLDQNGYVEGNLDEAVTAGKLTTSSAESDIRAEAPIDTLSNAVSPADVDLTIISPVENIDTEANVEADLDDEDAEGEQEEEEGDDDAEAGQDRSSRSRTPPPPDPPHPGASSDSNDDDPDADADAEGEMEFEDNEELPPTSTSSAVYQTALSVSMGQVPQGNFDGSFFDDDGWLIVFWIKSDKSFGYNTTWTHVLISAMVSGRLPSSLSILSDLSEKTTLRWLTPNKRSLWWARQRGGGQILM